MASKRVYTVGLVQEVQTGKEEKPFLAAWHYMRESKLEEQGYRILTVRFDGLDRAHARFIAEHNGGKEL